MPITVEKLGQTFFAVIRGIDAREPTAPENVSAIIDAIDDHGVLLFPGQTLDEEQAQWDDKSAVGVVLAAGGYPASFYKGFPIIGLDQPLESHQKIFHAGTAEKDGAVVTSGGRVLCATALGGTVSEAQTEAYKVLHNVRWDNVYFRNDIAYRAIARENK